MLEMYAFAVSFVEVFAAGELFEFFAVGEVVLIVVGGKIAGLAMVSM
jgi:hypothetical protein